MCAFRRRIGTDRILKQTAPGQVCRRGVSPERGVSLRDGGFFRAGLEKVVGAKFTTEYGTLEIGADTRGVIQMYPYREADLVKLEAGIEELSEKLEAASIGDREEAFDDLAKIGGPAIKQLKAAAKVGDAEVKARVADLLEKFETSGEARRPVFDVLRIGQRWIGAVLIFG